MLRIEEKLAAAAAKLHDDANQLEQETVSKVAELRAKADSLVALKVPDVIRNIPAEAHEELEVFFRYIQGVL